MASFQIFENVEIQKTMESMETQKPQETQGTQKTRGTQKTHELDEDDLISRTLNEDQGLNQRVVIREIRSIFNFSRHSFSSPVRKSQHQNII